MVLPRDLPRAPAPRDLAARALDDRDGIDAAEADQNVAVRHLGERVEVGPAVARVQGPDDVALGIEVLVGEPFPYDGTVARDLLDRLAVHLAIALGTGLSTPHARCDFGRHRTPLG